MKSRSQRPCVLISRFVVVCSSIFVFLILPNFVAYGQSGEKTQTPYEIDSLLDLPAPGRQSLASELGQKLLIRTSKNKRKLKGLVGIGVECINNTDKALLFDGTEAVLMEACTGKKRKCASLKEIELGISSPDGPRHRYVRDIQEAAVAFGSIGFAPSIDDAIKNNRSVPQRYGIDQVRRETEQMRLEKRVLYPGETANAFVYFKGKIPTSGASIELPVHDLNNEKDSANVSTAL